VRADAPARHKLVPHIPGVPKSVVYAIIRWERSNLWPGAVANAFDTYRRFVNRPQRTVYGTPGCCPCCIDYYGLSDDPRLILQEALDHLPRGKGRRFRRLVAELDDRYLSRSLPDPWAPPEWPWWRRRCLW